MPRPKCLACESPVIARGLCSKHYKRYSLEGFPDLESWLPTADVMPRPLRREPYPALNCPICNVEFTPGRSTQVLCAKPECTAQHKRNIANEMTAGRAHRGHVDRVCVVCESDFKGHPNSLVCGRTCRLARNKELTRRRHGSVQPACLVCGRLLPFQGGIFFTCPGECRDIARKRRNAKVYRNNPDRRERMVEARRRRKETDEEFADRCKEADRRRSRRLARDAFEISMLTIATKLEEEEPHE
jgi:hypothetical protein